MSDKQNQASTEDTEHHSASRACIVVNAFHLSAVHYYDKPAEVTTKAKARPPKRWSWTQILALTTAWR